MSSYNIRLSSVLTFDEEKEADIIQVIEKLNSVRKTGEFLSNLIRVSLDNPEILYKNNGKYAKGNTLLDLEKYGITFNRRALAEKNTKEISEMKNKIDCIYDMTLKMYTLALMNKHLELDKKSENTMMANFMLERQLDELKKALDINLIDNTYLSNKVKDTKKIAEDSLEFIINTYDGIINEIKSNISPNITISSLPVVENIEQVVDSNVPVIESSNVVENNIGTDNISKEDMEEQEEVIDFGMGDLSALEEFFGA